MTANWPAPGLDEVRRLRVMASGIPGAYVTERVLEAGFAEVWAHLTDLEGSFAAIEPDMRHVRVTRTDGEWLEARARSRFGMRARFDGVRRPGWCWLQSRFLLIGVAAAPEPSGGTRVALTGGIRVPGRAAIVPFGVRRAGEHSLDRLAALVTRHPDVE